MNNIKKLYILGAALIVVVVVILIGEQLGSKKPLAKTAAFFPGFTEAACSAFQFADDKDTVKVTRTGDMWTVKKVTSAAKAGADAEAIPAIAEESEEEKEQPAAPSETPEYLADSSSVHTAIEKLSIMKRDILVSQNPQKQETFEVDSAHGVLVEVWDRKGKSLGKVRVGKNGPDWSSNYVRSIGSDDVWAASGSIKHAFFTDIKRWRDKSIVKFDPSKAKQITIASKDTSSGKVSTVTIEKSLDTASNAVWTITAPEQAKAKPDVVDKLVEKLSQFKTSDWEEDEVSDSALGFGNPLLVATVMLENGDTHTITVGNKQKTGGKLYVRAEGKDEIFRVYDSAIRDFNKKLPELKAGE